MLRPTSYLDVPVLTGVEAVRARQWLEQTGHVATRAACWRARCGSLIVGRDGAVLGKGVNAAPEGCLDLCHKDRLAEEFKSDRTCCLHAEQAAVMDALRHHPDMLAGSTLYFTRVDPSGHLLPSGAPYCTICSKMTLAAGVSRFVLGHPDGIRSYDTTLYNALSFAWAPDKED